MTTRSTVEIAVSDILDIVSCSETYGYNDDVLLDALASLLDYECSDEEIEEYVEFFTSADGRAQGYNEDDEDNARTVVTNWRDKYCTGEEEDEESYDEEANEAELGMVDEDEELPF